jgi:hypothetical protein
MCPSTSWTSRSSSAERNRDDPTLTTPLLPGCEIGLREQFRAPR